MDTLRKAAIACAFLAALRMVEVLLKPGPHANIPVVVWAALITAKLWLAAAGLGVVALLWWATRRALGHAPPAPPMPHGRAPRALTPTERRLSIGRSLTAAWFVGSFPVAIVLNDTQVGPFAWAASRIMGEDAPVLGFALMVAGLAAPLVLLGLLPRQPQWPVFCGMQDAVGPDRRARPKRRR